MAKLLALDDVPLSLRNHLVRSLRSLDEAVLLPQADRRAESGIYKNVVFRLAGAEPNVPHDIFSSNWFDGASAVKVEGPVVTRILSDPVHRDKVLRQLKEAIPSEMYDDVVVGPELECDVQDCDLGAWTAGFDSPTCFVGLYCADHSSRPDPQVAGMDRVHQAAFLVCKAGAGVAAAKFDKRLCSALKKGATLEEVLERPEGSAALRRVSMAGSRNRARILELAGRTLGFALDTVPDQSSRGRYRGAVTQVDVCVNSIRRIEDSTSSIFQYSTCVDAAASQGLMTMSNVADGVSLMLSSGGEVRQTLRNDAHNTLPYSSMRLTTKSELIKKVVDDHRAAKGAPAHPDAEFIKSRFVWRNTTRERYDKEEHNVTSDAIEPLALWGLYDRENFLSKFARELGVATCQIVRLRPVAVLLSGVEPGKLRVAMRNLMRKEAPVAAPAAQRPPPAPPPPSVATSSISELFAARIEAMKLAAPAAAATNAEAQPLPQPAAADGESDDGSVGALSELE